MDCIHSALATCVFHNQRWRIDLRWSECVNSILFGDRTLSNLFGSNSLFSSQYQNHFFKQESKEKTGIESKKILLSIHRRDYPYTKINEFTLTICSFLHLNRSPSQYVHFGLNFLTEHFVMKNQYSAFLLRSKGRLDCTFEPTD